MTRVRFAGVDAEIDGRLIVSGVNLTAAPGEVVGVLGPNGSGKSTLLRTLYRALRPKAGTVLVGDDDVWRDLSPRTAARRTAAVTQHAPAELRLSVREVVLLGRIPHQGTFARTTTADHAAVREALDEVGLADVADRPYGNLSGGERQRVTLARALCQRPQVLVLDEPTNHLDIAHQLEFLTLVRRLGTTTLVVLHDLNLAAAHCDQLHLLSGGRVVAAGPVADVLTPERVREVFGVHAVVATHPVSGVPQLFLSTVLSEKDRDAPLVP